MPNISFTAIASASGSPGNFVASVMSNNFAAAVGVINSNNLDSVNYGASAFSASNISQSQVVSQHISNNAVAVGKVASEAVLNSNMGFASSDGGVQALRIEATSPPAGGFAMCRVSHTQDISHASTNSETIRVFWSNAVDGTPGFVSTPTPLAMILQKNTNISPSQPELDQWFVTAMDSVSADFYIKANGWNLGVTTTLTYHVAAIGPVG